MSVNGLHKTKTVKVQNQIEEVFRVDNILENIKQSVESNAKSEVEKGDNFCNWILKYMFERTDDEIMSCTEVSGKGDNSVDGWYEENNILYIIQAKYNTSNKWSSITNFIKDIDRLLLSPYKIIGSNDVLYELSAKIEEYMKNNKSVELYYVTDSTFTLDETKKIQWEKEKFEEKYKNVILYVYDINGIKDYFEMSLNTIPKRYRGHETPLLLKKSFISDITCVAEVALKDFAIFVSTNKEYLFYSNIRSYLKSTDVNNSIVETFKNKPTDFWYYNNGITIVCDDFRIDKIDVHLLHITTPQIVNGCQTANIILNEYKKLDDVGRKNLQGSILVKIIKDVNGKRKDDITRYTNKQNSVSGKDFFALDRFQKKLKGEFLQLGYYYEIQNKSSLFVKKHELNKLKGQEKYKYLFKDGFNNIIPVKEVVQAYASGMHFMPSTASSRSGELAPYGKSWGILFNADTPEDPYHFLFPYAVMQYAKYKLDYNSRSETDYKKNCLMLYVSTYFRTLIYLLKEINCFDKLANDNPLAININDMKAIFENEKINTSILKLTDLIIRFYIRDDKIKDLYGDKLQNFLKSTVQNNESAILILISKIKDCVTQDYSKTDLKELKELLES